MISLAAIRTPARCRKAPCLLAVGLAGCDKPVADRAAEGEQSVDVTGAEYGRELRPA